MGMHVREDTRKENHFSYRKERDINFGKEGLPAAIPGQPGKGEGNDPSPTREE